MKVWQIKKFGGVETMELVDLPTPEPKPHEALVKIEAAGLNYSDVMIRNGSYVDQVSLPLVLGREFAGKIEAVGKEVQGVYPGQMVAGMAGHGGAFGEFVAVPATQLIPVPGNMDTSQAAAFALQGITATHIVDDLAKLKAGETMLVHAAAGGVGTLAIQLGRMIGAKVIGTVSNEGKAGIVKRFGATAVDYSKDGWVEEVMAITGGKGADVILESVGGDIFLRSFREVLATFGRMIVFGAAGVESVNLSNLELLASNKTVTGYYLGSYFPDHADRVNAATHRLLGWIGSQKIQLLVGHTYPLDQTPAAFTLMESRKSVGKIVITM